MYNTNNAGNYYVKHDDIPFEEPIVGVSKKKKQENNKKSKRSVKMVLDSYKKSVRELKQQKKYLEKRLKSANWDERKEIQDLLSKVQDGFAAIADETKSITAELIREHPNSKVSKRVVEKMGYLTVQGYLNAYDRFDGGHLLADKLLVTRNGHELISNYGKISLRPGYMPGRAEVRGLDPSLISKFSDIAMQSEAMIEGETKSGHRR